MCVGKLPELRTIQKSKLKSNAFKINSSTRNTESKVRKRFAAN
ncbi:MAG TPA: hypothetical protein VFI70_09050 [Nitrososphaeraceae archaeon]|nr:hypothetical protein [Nitrososphaeraceae archaeon]